MKEDDSSFLARWSRRKHEAKQLYPEAPADESEVGATPVVESDVVPEFDLSSLPKLEEMTETTDITRFLQRGVPEHLRNAALRKSWSLDPAIRNYVNPALDYAYDWNTPGGVPGNGEIGNGMDVARLVSQIMGNGESVPEPAQSLDQPVAPEPESEAPTHALRLGNEVIVGAQPPLNIPGSAGIDAGTPSDGEDKFAAPQLVVRRHGSAKPLV